MIFRFFLLLALALLAGCAAQTSKDYAALRAADPHSILIVPAVNRSVYVNAPDYYLSTIAVPIAERGYYVFPVNLVKRMLEDDGLSDADLVHQADPKRLGALFGADAVLYVSIDRWDSEYIVISTTTTVEITYNLKDARTGEQLWTAHQKVAYTPQSSGGGIGGLIAQAIVSAIQKADPDYMPLARQANARAALLPHQGLPAGPHNPDYKKDLSQF